MSRDISTGNTIAMKLDKHGNPIPVFGWDPKDTDNYLLRSFTSVSPTGNSIGLAIGIYKAIFWEEPLLVETDVRIHYRINDSSNATTADPVVGFMRASGNGPDHDEASIMFQSDGTANGGIRCTADGISTPSTGVRYRLIRLL